MSRQESRSSRLFYYDIYDIFTIEVTGMAQESFFPFIMITADHGNADEMRVRNKKTKAWESSTKHSLNPVPFLIYDPKYDGSYHLKPYSPEHNNNLSHVAATNFVLLGKAIPDDLAPSLFTV